MWAVSTVLTGLLSFMLESTGTTGSLESSDDDKKQFAAASLAFNLRNGAFRSMFPMLEEAASAAGLDIDTNNDNNNTNEQPDTAREGDGAEEEAPLPSGEEAPSAAREAATSCRDVDGAQGGIDLGPQPAQDASPAATREPNVEASLEAGGGEAGCGMERADVSLEAVESLIRQGDPEGALVAIEEWLTSVPPVAEAGQLTRLKAEAQAALGDLDAAATTLSENDWQAAETASIAGRPAAVELRASALSKEKGDKAFRRRKFVDALEHYNEARKLTPNCAPLHSNAAAALMALGGKDHLIQALQACEKAIALSRNYPKALMRRADCLLGLGRNEEASAQYIKLVQLYPNDKSLGTKLEKAMEICREKNLQVET